MTRCRIGIVGSRSRGGSGEALVIERILALCPPGTVVVSGGAVGVDTLAAELAAAAGLAVDVIRPDYDGATGRIAAAAACFARNRILAESVAVLLAFPAATRKGGTENTIGHAKRAGIPVFVSLPGEAWAFVEPPRKIRRAPGQRPAGPELTAASLCELLERGAGAAASAPTLFSSPSSE